MSPFFSSRTTHGHVPGTAIHRSVPRQTNKRWCMCFYRLHCFISQFSSWKMTSWRAVTAFHTWKVNLSESFQFLIRMNGNLFLNIRRQIPTPCSILGCSLATWGFCHRVEQFNKQFDKTQSFLQTTTKLNMNPDLPDTLVSLLLTYWNNWY